LLKFNVFKCYWFKRGELPTSLPPGAHFPRYTSVRSTFLLRYFSSGSASAVSRVDITAAQSSGVSCGFHPSSSSGLQPDSLSENAALVTDATPITISGKILLNLTPPPRLMPTLRCLLLWKTRFQTLPSLKRKAKPSTSEQATSIKFPQLIIRSVKPKSQPDHKK